ncbi:terminase (plasmid) [Shewanella sp. NFH-SH190041]|nr:terminase [Shewanella sp. NFH-SH190041]
MDCISNDDIQEVDFIKSARVGATKMMLAALGYFHHHKRRNTLFYQPTDTDAEDFSLTEIAPMLRDVAVMKEVFPWGETSNKYNRTLKKTFIGSILDIRGGKAGTNYRRMTKDVVFYDELEAFDRDIEGEGSPLVLGDKRVSNALYPKSVRGTTPKDEEGSIIAEEVASADFFFHFHVPCPHCELMQVLRWGGRDTAYGFKFKQPSDFPDSLAPKDDAAASVYYCCAGCGGKIFNQDLDAISERGRWQDQDTQVWIDADGQFRKANDERIKPPRHVAFHIWTAYSPWYSWQSMLLDFFAAMEQKKKKGLLDKFKAFVNTTLGETWKDGTRELNGDSLYNRRIQYPIDSNGEMRIPRPALALFAGLDMQDDRIEGELRAFDELNRSYLVDYFRIYGDPKQNALWDEVERRLKQTYLTEDGRQLTLTRCCFDSGGHFTKEVYAFCKRLGVYLCIPTKGWNDYDQPTTFPRKANRHGVYLTMVDTESAKDTLSSRHALILADNDDVPAGYCFYPVASFTDETYFQQLTAEEKVLKRHNRKHRMVWISNGRRNEPWDCAVGSLTALELSQQYFGLDMASLAAARDNPQQNMAAPNGWAELGRRSKR